MCWCIKVSCTLAGNLMCRLINDMLDFLCSGCHKINTEDHYECSLSDEQYDFDISIKTPPRELKLTIECEQYFRAVDRTNAEDILRNRVDGSCLVRPYKTQDECVKYILTIYAKNNFFHLYVRKAINGKFALGLEKPKEKYFNTPNDIINYYRLNRLQCTNATINTSLVLVPIA